MAVAVSVATNVVITTVPSPILLYRHYSPDQLISRTTGPIMTKDLSVHGDLNVNSK